METVLLGVTGGIAAYKACEIVRGLQKANVKVKVVMTEHATHFIDPLTFRSLTNEQVAIELFDDPTDPIHHISLAKECDLFLIAPCTANMIAKMATGIADDLLTTTALACTSPIVIAPAMNVNMYENPATQHNLEVLRQRGVFIIEAEEGYLACGDCGKGKLAEVDAIVNAALELLHKGKDLSGKSILVTAGPTIEAIDPVRYLSNHSSGKMGFAIAECAAKRGAAVTLIAGPVERETPAGVDRIDIQTAEEMLEAASDIFSNTDIAIFSAAVCDVRPKHVSKDKLKKGTDDAALSELELIPNPDVIASLAKHKKDDQYIVGFAAETDNVIEHAQEKLVSKHADMIVANEVGPDKAFGKDDNRVAFVTHDEVKELPEMAKTKIAELLLDEVLKSVK